MRSTHIYRGLACGILLTFIALISSIASDIELWRFFNDPNNPRLSAWTESQIKADTAHIFSLGRYAKTISISFFIGTLAGLLFFRIAFYLSPIVFLLYGLIVVDIGKSYVLEGIHIFQSLEMIVCFLGLTIAGVLWLKNRSKSASQKGIWLEILTGVSTASTIVLVLSIIGSV